MKLTRIAYILLAVSPGIALVLGIVGLSAFRNVWLALVGYLAIYGPLAYLAIISSDYDYPRGVRALLWLSTGSVALVALGVAFAFSPDYMLVRDSGPPAVKLAPALRRPGAYEVQGLNVRRPPVIKKAPPNMEFFFSIDMSQKGGSRGVGTPGTAEDGYGNHMKFTETRPGVLRMEDNVGGFAEVDWNGAQPVLGVSHAVRRTATARGPAPFTYRAVGIGQLLVCIGPLAAWMLLTVALIRMADSHTRGVLCFSLLAQGVGLGIDGLLILIATVGSRSGEDGILMAFVMLALMIPSVIASLIGVTILSIALLRAG